MEAVLSGDTQYLDGYCVTTRLLNYPYGFNEGRQQRISKQSSQRYSNRVR